MIVADDVQNLKKFLEFLSGFSLESVSVVMALSPTNLQDYIHYYGSRENWVAIENLLAVHLDDTNEVRIFWSAVCLLKRGETEQSASLFKQIYPNSDYNLAAMCGLVETYLMSQHNDAVGAQSQISKIKSNIKSLSKTACWVSSPVL